MSYTSEFTGAQIDNALRISNNIGTHAGIPVSDGRGGITVVQAKSEPENSANLLTAEAIMKAVRDAKGGGAQPPYIGANGNWYIYNANRQSYEDSGISARGEKGDPGPSGGVSSVNGKNGTVNLTAADVNAVDAGDLADYLPLTAGTGKKLTGTLYMNHASATALAVQDTATAHTSTPASSFYRDLISQTDYNSKRVAVLRGSVATDGVRSLLLGVSDANDSAPTGLTVFRSYATLPSSPAAGDNSTKLATTAFVKTAIDNAIGAIENGTY